MQISLPLIAVMVLLGLNMICLWIVIYQLMKQHGRVLLRLDEAEYRLGHTCQDCPDRETQGKAVQSGAVGQPVETPMKSRLPSQRPLTESRIEREGIKAGTPAPVFNLPDIYGQPVSLEQFQGQRVLLVFTDPHCGPCDALAPHLVHLHRRRPENGLALVVVGHGDLEENRRKAEQHGFDFPVVVQPQWKISKEYGIFATPVAFLINEAGVIARNVAAGADAILALAQEQVATREE